MGIPVHLRPMNDSASTSLITQQQVLDGQVFVIDKPLEWTSFDVIGKLRKIFKIKKIPIWLKPYEILATGANCGIIECVSDTQSLDEIHKLREGYMTLADYF